MTVTFECILVDDGSPDNSPKICDEYALKDKRIKVIHQKNAGVSAARNAGIKISSGEYIGFVDGDDEILPETYDIAINTALNNKADIVQWGFKSFFCNKEKNYCFHTGFFNFSCDNGNLITEEEAFLCYSVCNKLFKATLIKNNSITFPLGLSNFEDSFFVFYCYIFSKKVYSISNVLYIYYNNDESVTHHYISQKVIQKGVDILNEIAVFSKEHSSFEKMSYLLYCKKKEIKMACIDLTKKPDLKSWKKTFPELNKNMYAIKRPVSIAFFCARIGLYGLENLMLCFYNTFFKE